VSATLPAAAPSSDTAREVAVSVTADPPWARLSLDGRDLEANPFRGKLPADGKPHTLTAAAPGFSTDERSVSLDRDVKVDVALRVLASPPTPAASGQRPSSAAAPRLRTAPRAPTNAAHSIDSDDPYGATR
jgi:hypothetical protein